MSEINSGNLTRNILIAMVAGIVIGMLCYYLRLNDAIAGSTVFGLFDTVFLQGLVDIVGQLFVKSLKVLVVPLVFVSLVCGVASLKDVSTLGGISVKTLGLYFMSTALAISLALLMGNIFLQDISVEALEKTAFTPKESPGLKAVLINLFPTNIVEAMANAEMLQIIIFAILFGLAVNTSGDSGKAVLDFFVALDKVIMKLVVIVMAFAPFGVFALMVAMFYETGPEHVIKLASYFATVASTLVLHIGVVMVGIFTLFTRLNPLILLSKARNLWMFAFSTSSSNASIPVTLNMVENRLGVNNNVAAFTVPLGATINMDGTAIMQGVATVFIAQVYGIEVGLVGYLTVIATATLASIGTAGVPGVGLITLAMVLEQAGLPVEGIALIIGVDRLLDMMRTAVNVTGDAIVTTIVAKSEGQFDKDVYQRID